MDHTNETYGDWTVVSRVGATKQGVSWLCRCQCGKTQSVLQSRLKHLTSCQSCANRKRRKPAQPRSFYEDRVGQTHGKWTVVSYVGIIERSHIWLVRCECGKERQMNVTQFSGTYMCRTCANKERGLPLEERRRRMRARGVAQKKEQRMTRWERGECTQCPRERLPDLALCEFHRAIRAEMARVYRMLHIPHLRQIERETRPARKAT